MPPLPNSPGPASAPSSVGGSALNLPGWYLYDSDWKPGTIVQFAPLGSVPRVVVAASDGTLQWVDTEHVRHGEKPANLPRLATDHSAGHRPHTLRLYQNKWMLASPDGRVLKEYPNDEVGVRDANAHHDRLEPELAKARAEAEKPARKPA